MFELSAQFSERTAGEIIQFKQVTTPSLFLESHLNVCAKIGNKQTNEKTVKKDNKALPFLIFVCNEKLIKLLSLKFHLVVIIFGDGILVRN